MSYGQGCLRPDNQFKAYFAHLKTINGTGCWMVNAGDVIGIVDTTGNSEGNHLHYELRGAGDIRNYLGLDQDQYDRLGGCVSQNYCQVNLPK
jgi:murein DD-endopeptidase MepM/ murein hydrolase activator NlpD